MTMPFTDPEQPKADMTDRYLLRNLETRLEAADKRIRRLENSAIIHQGWIRLMRSAIEDLEEKVNKVNDDEV